MRITNCDVQGTFWGDGVDQRRVNGYLKDFSRNDDTYNVQQLTEGIRQLVATDLNQLKANTRKSVRMFQDSIIAEKWSELIDAL